MSILESKSRRAKDCITEIVLRTVTASVAFLEDFLVRIFVQKIMENDEIMTKIIFRRNRHFYASKLSGMSILPSKSRGANFHLRFGSLF
jgi:hypothetical protein